MRKIISVNTEHCLLISPIGRGFYLLGHNFNPPVFSLLVIKPGEDSKFYPSIVAEKTDDSYVYEIADVGRFSKDEVAIPKSVEFLDPNENFSLEHNGMTLEFPSLQDKNGFTYVFSESGEISVFSEEEPTFCEILNDQIEPRNYHDRPIVYYITVDTVDKGKHVCEINGWESNSKGHEAQFGYTLKESFVKFLSEKLPAKYKVVSPFEQSSLYKRVQAIICPDPIPETSELLDDPRWPVIKGNERVITQKEFAGCKGVLLDDSETSLLDSNVGINTDLPGRVRLRTITNDKILEKVVFDPAASNFEVLAYSTIDCDSFEESFNSILSKVEQNTHLKNSGKLVLKMPRGSGGEAVWITSKSDLKNTFKVIFDKSHTEYTESMQLLDFHEKTKSAVSHIKNHEESAKYYEIHNFRKVLSYQKAKEYFLSPHHLVVEPYLESDEVKHPQTGDKVVEAWRSAFGCIYCPDGQLDIVKIGKTYGKLASNKDDFKSDVSSSMFNSRQLDQSEQDQDLENLSNRVSDFFRRMTGLGETELLEILRNHSDLGVQSYANHMSREFEYFSALKRARNSLL